MAQRVHKPRHDSVCGLCHPCAIYHGDGTTRLEIPLYQRFQVVPGMAQFFDGWHKMNNIQKNCINNH